MKVIGTTIGAYTKVTEAKTEAYKKMIGIIIAISMKVIGDITIRLAGTKSATNDMLRNTKIAEQIELLK